MLVYTIGHLINRPTRSVILNNVTNRKMTCIFVNCYCIRLQWRRLLLPKIFFHQSASDNAITRYRVYLILMSLQETVVVYWFTSFSFWLNSRIKLAVTVLFFRFAFTKFTAVCLILDTSRRPILFAATRQRNKSIHDANKLAISNKLVSNQNTLKLANNQNPISIKYTTLETDGTENRK